jgi:hypothetical protein
MAESKVFTALLKLSAKLDSSFSASMRKAVAEMDALDKKTAAIGKGDHFGKLANNAQKSFEKVGHSSERMADRVKESLLRIGEFATGGLLADGIEGLIEKFKEFGKGSFEVRADREVLQNQLHAVLNSQGTGYLQSGIDMMIRRFSDNEAAVKFEPAMEMVSQLLAAAPGRFKDVASIHEKLGQIADLSKDEATFKLAGQAYTRMLAEGRVDATHLREISVDTGFPIRQYMAQALHMSNEQLSEALKKHKLTGEQQLAALDEGLRLVTSQGGPAYGHAGAQMTGLKGIANRFEERWRDFEESFGRGIEEFISPLSERILKAIGPAELTHVFDGINVGLHRFGLALGDLWDKLRDNGAFERLGALSKHIGDLLNQKLPWLNYKSFTNPATGDIETLKDPATEARLDKSAKSIDHIVDALSKFTDFAFKDTSKFDNWAAGEEKWENDLEGKINSFFKPIDDAIYTQVSNMWTKIADLFSHGIQGILDRINSFHIPGIHFGSDKQDWINTPHRALQAGGTYREPAFPAQATAGTHPVALDGMWLNFPNDAKSGADALAIASKNAGNSLDGLGPKAQGAGDGLKSALDGVQAALQEASNKIRNLQFQAPQAQSGMDHRSLTYSFS